jgi:tripartite-type tricarboxylate transporter receptor subunit TctC
VRALAVTSSARHPAVPDLPTVAESVPGYRYTVWYGLLAPAGTPAPVVQRLNAATAKILQAHDTQEKLAGEGLQTITSTPEEFAAYLKSEVETWAKVVRAAGLHAD